MSTANTENKSAANKSNYTVCKVN